MRSSSGNVLTAILARCRSSASARRPPARRAHVGTGTGSAAGARFQLGRIEHVPSETLDVGSTAALPLLEEWLRLAASLERHDPAALARLGEPESALDRFVATAGGCPRRRRPPTGELLLRCLRLLERSLFGRAGRPAWLGAPWRVAALAWAGSPPPWSRPHRRPASRSSTLVARVLRDPTPLV
jgi:hypothetical protein